MTSPGTSIVDNNALTGALRTLKLGGILQTLDARLAQARAGELGHLEFLPVLCLDEISRRETTAIPRRTRRARFEQTATLEGFDPPRRSATWPPCAGSRPGRRDNARRHVQGCYCVPCRRKQPG